MLVYVACAILASLLHSAHGQSGSTGEIAFSVGLTHQASVPDSHAIVYDRIFTNIGNAYDSSTGIFTCPQDGIYVFQVHALSTNGSDTWLELRHNYHYVFSVYGHTDNDYATSGNSAILQLTKGDQVSVVGVVQWYSELYAFPDEVYNTFAGYLISPIFQDMPVVGKK